MLGTLTDVSARFHETCDSCGTSFVRKVDVPSYTGRFVFEDEVKGKPEAVREKILEGKLSAYFSEMVLLNQPFIKDATVTIQGLVDRAVQKFGEKTAIGRFVRFKVLEKRGSTIFKERAKNTVL